MLPELSPDAKEMLSRLKSGDGRDIGVPSVYPGLQAFSTHAMAFFESAVALCREPRTHDFIIFGALYCVRHGLELWLKFVTQTQVLEDVLFAITTKKTFDDVVEAAQSRCGSEGERKARKQQLVKALCFLRNLDAKVDPAEGWTTDVSESFARQMLADGKDLNQLRLGHVWPVPVHGHDLQALWKEAEEPVTRAYQAEHLYGEDIEAVPLPPATLGALCELLGTLDPSGDGFRYPNSLAGKWFIDLPSLSLRSLGRLAEGLEESALWYEDRINPC